MKRILPILIFFFACKKSNTQPEPAPERGYEKMPQAYVLKGATVKETSGITYSLSSPGILWVQEDSGNPPTLYRLQYDGTFRDSVVLTGAVNRDWEDITSGPGPQTGVNYLYVADVGDNDSKYDDCTIYRLPEPGPSVKSVDGYETIKFSYPDSSHDAEAILVDPGSKDILVITKRDTRSRVYRIPYPQNTTAANEAVFVLELPFSGVVSAALSADNKELIVKTYTQLHYYSRNAAEALATTLAAVPANISYQLEPQGESVSFAHDGSGFFTLSEEAMSIVPKLNFYRKK